MVPHIRLGAFVLAGTLVLSASSGIARPAAVEAADWACPPSAAGVPLEEEVVTNPGSVGDYAFHCRYTKATKKRFIGSIYVNLQWIDADSKAASWIDLAEWCSPSTSESESHTYPYLGEKLVRADWGAVAAAGEGKWDRKGHRAVKELAATIADRAGSCGLDYSSATAAGPATDIEPDAAAPVTPSTTTTTIVLSGGPGEEPPAIGATVPLPEDDQHRIVIGGLDGQIIREEYLGDQATIVSYGPMATDIDGNWSVSVEVGANTVPAPSAEPPSPAPSTTPSVAPVPSEVPSAPPSPTVEPSVLPDPVTSPPAKPAPAPMMTPEAETSPTPVPPPEMMAMPKAVAAYVAGLEPEAAGVVRDLSDYLGALGDELIEEGVGEVTIPASEFASLRLLAPGLVNEVRLVPGGIVVDSLVDVLVTPVIGEDGLIEFRTNRLPDKIRSHEIVKALVLALNNYVLESGGRFRTISVTPEGLTVTAERRPSS